MEGCRTVGCPHLKQATYIYYRTCSTYSAFALHKPWIPYDQLDRNRWNRLEGNDQLPGRTYARDHHEVGRGAVQYRPTRPRSHEIIQLFE